MRRALLLATVGSLACSADRPGSATPIPLSAPVPPLADVVSEPTEYAAQTPSATAGEAFFSHYGVGDPYAAGVPYPVFLALRALYPERLGRDWLEFSAQYGTIPNRERPTDPDALPVGFHLATDPITRVDFLMINCHLCHADLVEADGRQVFIAGMGNRTLRLHAYDDAFVRIGQDDDLRVGRLLAATTAAAKDHGLAWPPDHRRPIVSETLRKVRHRAEIRGADSARLAAGLPGRVATIEGFMLALNEQYDAQLELPSTIGWAKIPDVATWRYRETNSFDGVSTGAPVAMVAGADFAFGVRPQWYLGHQHIATSMFLYLRGFSRDLEFPGPIDAALAKSGEGLFDEHCAGCHGDYSGRYVGYEEQVVPLSVVQTDPARIEAVTPAFAKTADGIEETRGLVVTHASDGYVPRPLVDVWARGTYGHAGQWPDLATLATPPEQRPQRFVVDLGAPLDLERVGVAWSANGSEGPQRHVYDARVPGYGNGGHEFLSDLASEERQAVLEYLKTL
ncbi:MAG: hypothetical protein AAF799_03675 [Myxococcota bacterium]